MRQEKLASNAKQNVHNQLGLDEEIKDQNDGLEEQPWRKYRSNPILLYGPGREKENIQTDYFLNLIEFCL